MTHRLVVTGLGMVTPLGADADTSFQRLMAGEKAKTILTGPEWKGFKSLPRAAQALEVWIPRKLLQRDRSLQLASVAAWEAWRQAGLFGVPPEKIGTTFSSSKGGLLSLLTANRDQENLDWDFLSDFFPHAGGQLFAQQFGFSGPGLSVSSACSTGIASLSMAARLLLDRECDAVLAGSTESSIHPLIYAGFDRMGILSQNPEGPSPFDVNRDGFLMGEGSGVLVIEREDKVKKRKAVPLALLSGWALVGDAHDPLEVDPTGKTIVHVIRLALERAGLKPKDVGYINAHGTGTRFNDLVESKAISEVFGQEPWASSTKGATGHLLGAAGSVEAVISVLALIHGKLPATAGLQNPDSQCRVKHVPPQGLKQKVDHVLSLSYGFGGQLGAVIFSKV
jgi:3-oxoacyl-[acyl-carrier-protein] synthase II